jgi:hypothetical protein
MKKHSIIFIVICFVTGLATAVLPAVNMQEGNWEMTIKTDMSGAQFKLPPMKYTTCITKDNMNPQKSQKNQNCKIISSKIEGSTYSWVSECTTKEGKMKSEGSITYRGTTMDGIITTITNKMKMKQMISGRRLGACKK